MKHECKKNNKNAMQEKHVKWLKQRAIRYGTCASVYS